MHKSMVMLVMSLVLCLAIGSPVQAQDKSADKISVFASILPAAAFVQRVGGTHVDVTVLVGAGQDPHTFDPSPQLMAKLARARALFKMGFPFEEALVKKIGATFKNVEVVDLQKGIALREMTPEELEAEEHSHHHEHGEHHKDGEHHEHGEEHEHGHEAGEKDPHTWLDPLRAKMQAQTIAEALIRIDPKHKSDYERNLADFQKDLDAVDKQLSKVLAPVKGKSFYVFHPAYGYFADRYGLKQVAVESQGKEPTAKQLARLIDRAKADKVKIIFVEPQFSKKSAQALSAAIGGAVVPLDPLSGDYLKNLKTMADALESALSKQR